MPIHQVDGPLGAYEDDQAPGAGGTYAVIIGVSKYPYLKDGGSARKGEETFGLGQLYSSALTAYRFFEWLRERYRWGNSPLRRCWLLLAPTPAETGKIGKPHFGEPTFNNATAAIRAWYDALKSVDAQAAQENSRTIFFFSGHGLEVDLDQQILLPSDYLAGGAAGLNDAMSTHNLYAALSNINIPNQFFFIDACRNDIQQLRAVSDLTGARILTYMNGVRFRRSAPIIYGSNAGDVAWQYSNVDDGITFFGQALLDGLQLTGLPPFEPDRRYNPWRIPLDTLFRYANDQVVRTLQREGRPQPQPLAQGGTVWPDTFVCEIGPPPLPEAGPRIDMGRDIVAAGPWEAEAVNLSVAQDEPTPHRRGERRPLPPKAFDLDGVRFISYGRASRDFGMAHGKFGHETTTQFFVNMRAFAWWDQAGWIESPSPTMVDVARTDDASICRTSFEFDDPAKWHWLLCNDFTTDYGFLFPPTDREMEAVKFCIEVVERQGIVSAQAFVSSLCTSTWLHKAAELWELYRTSTASAAADTLKDAVDALEAKWESPLAATVAALVLLRTGFGAKIQRWVRNLSDNVNYSSDPAILLLRQEYDGLGQGDFAHAVAACLDKIRSHGAPFTSEGFGYALNLLQSVRDDTRADDSTRDRASSTLKRWRGLSTAFRAGGLFLGFHAKRLELDAGSGLASLRVAT